MLRPRSLVRAVVNVAAIAPELVRRGYQRVEDDRKAQEKHLATLAHAPTRRDTLSAHLCDLALAVASPTVRVPARAALRQVIFDVVRGTSKSDLIDDEEEMS